jgi:hypothetical protein
VALTVKVSLFFFLSAPAYQLPGLATRTIRRSASTGRVVGFVRAAADATGELKARTDEARADAARAASQSASPKRVPTGTARSFSCDRTHGAGCPCAASARFSSAVVVVLSAGMSRSGRGFAARALSSLSCRAATAPNSCMKGEGRPCLWA